MDKTVIDRAIDMLRDVLGLVDFQTEDLHAGEIRTALMEKTVNGDGAEASKYVVDHQDLSWGDVDYRYNSLRCTQCIGGSRQPPQLNPGI